MPDRQGQTEEERESADDDVGDPEERVPTADEADGAEYDRLGALVLSDRVVCARMGR